ncbi:MAG: sigma-70 family RNA polymerase sigma factor, partial [Clostridia bacterium]|nr:sigma-70 family RNA polymerase sigma factor [Clostridia bacterium]
MSQGQVQARERLILHNLRLVSHIVRKYYGTAKNQEDLISIGTIGLVKAVDSFNPDNGARFATYAAKCIQNEILMHFRSQKKLSAEVSINETIDVDRDGNPLTYIDV